ncbi:hypothetical protein TrVFT333_001354 [Trichoderma virens FT-333]|nr:hypothetical protein TrVFT333_001354 [Trichoderma virens FT-333]
MYSANYGFGNAAPNFNNPAGTPQPGMQPGQQVMFNRQQQFAGMAPQGVAYQQQFPGASYGQVLPTGVGPQGFVPNNYMMGPGMPGFPMGQPGMPQQQQMMQRMQQQQQQQPQQQTPEHSPRNADEHHASPAASVLDSPAHVSGTDTHEPTTNGIGHPQTPTFSSNPAGGMAGPSTGTVPMSPTTEALEKERFALLLDINHELLYESIQIQTTLQELKKEFTAVNGNIPDRKPSEEENHFQQDYLHCMRRLQANLSYMAALADRKPEVKGPPCPAYLSAPPLNLTLRPRGVPIGAENSTTPPDPVVDREERNKSIMDLYRRLQAVFPTFDPKKEPAFRTAPSGQKPGNPMAPSQQASPAAQRTPQLPNMPGPPMNLQPNLALQ